MVTASPLLLTAVIFPIILSVTTLVLQITPKRAHIKAGTRLKIMCQADSAITGCQFKRSFVNNIYDLSAGSQMKSNNQYEYYGAGLDAGECGISLNEYVKDHQYDLIGCRVRQATGGWVYESMAVIINANESFLFDLMPRRELLVKPGDDVTMLCRGDQPLSSCFFKWPGLQTAVALNNTITSRNYRYFGKGLEKGHCGITILNVTPSMSGDVYCSAWTRMRPKGYESDTTPLIVASPPMYPELKLSKSIFVAGDILEASCVVRNSRPISNITWFLGSDVLRQDVLNDATPETEWLWRYDLQTIQQNVTRTLAWDDDGKALKCVAGHFSLPGGQSQNQAKISVKYAPRDIPQPIRVTGYNVGDMVEITLKILANPKPAFQWTYRNQTFRENSSDGRVLATSGTKLSDAWVVRLIIASSKQEDFGQDIFLSAINDVGENMYRIRIVEKNPRIPITSETTKPSIDRTSQQDSSQWDGERTNEDEYVTEDTSETTNDDQLLWNISDGSAQKQSGDGKLHYTATVVLCILTSCVLIIGAVISAWYARATSRWCFSGQQFASAQLLAPSVGAEENYDAGNLNITFSHDFSSN